MKRKGSRREGDDGREAEVEERATTTKKARRRRRYDDIKKAFGEGLEKLLFSTTMSLVGTTTPLCCVCFETLGAKGGPATLPCGERKGGGIAMKKKPSLLDPLFKALVSAPLSLSPSPFFFPPSLFYFPTSQPLTFLQTGHNVSKRAR